MVTVHMNYTASHHFRQEPWRAHTYHETAEHMAKRYQMIMATFNSDRSLQGMLNEMSNSKHFPNGNVVLVRSQNNSVSHYFSDTKQPSHNGSLCLLQGGVQRWYTYYVIPKDTYCRLVVNYTTNSDHIAAQTGSALTFREKNRTVFVFGIHKPGKR
ncbi:uncharacterized protein V1510DRAFT_408298 [Dipodascopsis tothii]|uniref:uncharacterized protein n=1 Tax=Dipodascopsis tothii TaxID=44089 RepID=UPI0034CE4071